MLNFQSGLRDADGKPTKKVQLYFDLVIKDLQRTVVSMKDIISIPEKAPLNEERSIKKYFSVAGPLFEIRKSYKQLDRKGSSGRYLEEYIQI